MIVYLDNYRGFQEQFIPTSGLNLIVGENSTGKSSFMSMLCLLSDPDFLATGRFKNDFVDLGPFDELVNQNGDKKTIHLGVCKEPHDEHSLGFSFDGIGLKFNSKKGYTNLKEILLVKNKSALWIEMTDNSIQYILYSINADIAEYQNIIKKFSRTSKLQFKVHDKGSLESMDGFLSFVNRFFFAAIMAIIMKGPEGDNNDERRILYSDFLNLDKSQNWLEHQTIISNETVWIDPIRSEPKRIYEPDDTQFSPTGTHIPTVLRELYSNQSNKSNKKTWSQIEKFGIDSGLFDGIEIHEYSDEELSPFELNIRLKGKKHKITNVGYGVSQSLPIVTEIARRRKHSIFLVQQPEVHLHPKSQAFIGEFIYDQFINEGKTFFVETHSDFIIDRIRTKVRKSSKKDVHKSICVLFFEQTKEGNTCYRVNIDKNGEYNEDQPKSFREFFLQEELDILGFEG